ncbi:MAG: hypothetical protein N4A37_11585 [Prolixibacteraceae bacterium]|jgi:hypothetical protein|nr:hypothetical protein [Prolixibacteraceae bacterium]
MDCIVLKKIIPSLISPLILVGFNGLVFYITFNNDRKNRKKDVKLKWYFDIVLNSHLENILKFEESLNILMHDFIDAVELSVDDKKSIFINESKYNAETTKLIGKFTNHILATLVFYNKELKEEFEEKLDCFTDEIQSAIIDHSASMINRNDFESTLDLNLQKFKNDYLSVLNSPMLES